jgi:PIN domain nuclease of toxin-antitoxin system
MSTVLDAAALLSLLLDEPGAEVVQNLVSRTEACYVHALNL